MPDFIRILSVSIILLSISFQKIDSQEKAPEFYRLISLGPYITEEIYLLNMEGRLVGDTIYCIKPGPAKKIEKIGDIMNINIEKIYGLKPDIVFATSLTSRQSLESLKKLSINVVRFRQPADFNEICSQFLEMGKILGGVDTAKKIIKNAVMKTASVRQAVKNLPLKKVFLEVGTKPLFTQSKNSFVNDMIESAGGINIAKNSPDGIYNYEAVVSANPDVIIITDMGLNAREAIDEWRKYPLITAVKNNSIFIIDEYGIGSPTPVNFSITLRTMVKMIHPEIAAEITNE